MLSPKLIEIYQVEGSSRNLDFLNHHSSPLIEGLIDTTHTLARSSDIASEDRFEEGRRGEKLKSVVESSCSGHDLTSTSMDSISVELTVSDVESHSSHVLVAEDTLLGSPLEGGDH